MRLGYFNAKALCFVKKFEYLATPPFYDKTENSFRCRILQESQNLQGVMFLKKHFYVIRLNIND